MINTESAQWPDEVPEADRVEQLIPVDTGDDDQGLDPARLADATTVDADPADLLDQAASIPQPDDDYDER